MGKLPSLEELIELTINAFATLIEDLMSVGDWIAAKLAELRDL